MFLVVAGSSVLHCSGLSGVIRGFLGSMRQIAFLHVLCFGVSGVYFLWCTLQVSDRGRRAVSWTV